MTDDELDVVIRTAVIARELAEPVSDASAATHAGHVSLLRCERVLRAHGTWDTVELTHLRDCDSCQRMIARFFDDECPAPETLLTHVQAPGASVLSDAVRQHTALGGCLRCRFLLKVFAILPRGTNAVRAERPAHASPLADGDSATAAPTFIAEAGPGLGVRIDQSNAAQVVAVVHATNADGAPISVRLIVTASPALGAPHVVVDDMTADGPSGRVEFRLGTSAELQRRFGPRISILAMIAG